NILSLLKPESNFSTSSNQQDTFPSSPFVLYIILKLNQINLDFSQIQINENTNSLLDEKFV
ncbi:10352_t:CDS:1, partial [Diversispora eburnea]